MDNNYINKIKNAIDSQYSRCIQILNKKVNKPVILCGYSSLGKLFEGMLNECNLKILAVCDEGKVGEEYGYTERGVISSYSKLDNIRNDVQVIIASIDYYEEIKKNVTKYISEEAIVNIKEIYEIIPKCHELIRPSIYAEYIKNNINRLNRLMDNLTDKKSVCVLENVIKMRLTWNEQYVNEIYDNTEYFIEEINLTENEVFIDGGAYIGDTVDEFLKHVNNKFDKIYCFEPGKKQYKELENNISKYNFKDKIIMYNSGLYSSNMNIGFTGFGAGFRMNKSSKVNECKVIPIDELNINPTLIKLDVEGSELEALKGSVKSIKKYKPNLAICVYHKMTDILDIADWITNLELNYKLYLRHHSKTMNDTVLYAVQE